MANVINGNSNQNDFQFHGSHYKYEKREPLGLPMSRSIFKNFLQNLEGKFIKSSNKSRALIHHPTGCTRRHCHIWLIYFILPASYGSSRPLWETLMVLTDLYASSHPLWPLPWNSQCSRGTGISNNGSQQSWCTHCYQVRSSWDYMATMAVAKGTLHKPNQYTYLLMIQW